MAPPIPSANIELNAVQLLYLSNLLAYRGALMLGLGDRARELDHELCYIEDRMDVLEISKKFLATTNELTRVAEALLREKVKAPGG